MGGEADLLLAGVTAPGEADLDGGGLGEREADLAAALADPHALGRDAQLADRRRRGDVDGDRADGPVAVAVGDGERGAVVAGGRESVDGGGAGRGRPIVEAPRDRGRLGAGDARLDRGEPKSLTGEGAVGA